MARIFPSALVLLALVGVARADFITKKDGTVIEGEVTHRDESRVVVTLKDGTVVDIPRSAIERITKERPDPNRKTPDPGPMPPAAPKTPPTAEPDPKPAESTPAEVDSSTPPSEPLRPSVAPVATATKPRVVKKDGPPDYEDLLAEYMRLPDEPSKQAFVKKYDKKGCRLTATLLEMREGTITMTIGSRDDPDGMKIEVPCLRLKVQTAHGAVSEGYPVYINKLLSVPKAGETPRCDLTDINKMKKAPRGSTIFIDGKILAGRNPPMALCDPKYSFTPPKKDP
jgi:hypothetical protein